MSGFLGDRLDFVPERALRSLPRLIAGIGAGGALFSGVVSAQVQRQLDTHCRIVTWRKAFPGAMKFQVGAQLGTVLLGGINYLRDGDSKWLYLLGPVAFNILFTLTAMHPVNGKLLDQSLDTNSDEAKNLHEKWVKLHAVRIGVMLSLFILVEAVCPN